LEHFDVLIIGAGLSGVGAAVHLHERCPTKRYLILEGRSAYTEEVTRRLYPNREELRQGEQRRWEITAQHWDDFLVEASEQP